MKKHRFSNQIAIFATVLLFSGCGIFSLHPLYHKEDLKKYRYATPSQSVCQDT